MGPFEHGGFAINYTASTQILKYRIVAFASTDKGVTQAADPAVTLIGVSSDIDSEAGEPCDVWRCGLRRVVYGATIAKGQWLTTDTEGRAIPAVAGNATIGFAEIDGLTDDLGSVYVHPGQI